MHIIPIASGKGGVGKSLFSANLALTLGQAGKSVVLIDMDLGGSNLHLILGIRNLPKGIGTFVNDARAQFEDIIIDTGYKNVRFIPGDAEIPGMANLGLTQKKRLIKNIVKIQADYIIIDLGAGTTQNTVDFFLLARQGIIVTTPSPTSLVNGYLFLKNAIFRIIQQAMKKNSPGAQYLDMLVKSSKGLQRIYVQDLMKKLEDIDPKNHKSIKDAFSRFMPRLVFNMIEDPKDADKVQKLRRSTQQYLGIDLEHLGIMYRDDLQDIALHAGLPIVSYKPKSVLSQAIYRIADKILQSAVEYDVDGVLTEEELEQSYETAEAEADVDFQAKLEYIEDLVQTGTITMGDLLETVKTQQLEISHLRKENNLLKSKILRAAAQGFKL